MSVTESQRCDQGYEMVMSQIVTVTACDKEVS